MTIDFSQISVVVQGPVSSLTRRCLLSIRKYLPKAEVILSTWENSNVEGLSFDKVVFSKDPGGVLLGEYKNKKYYDNLNRQIVSTRVGLAQATRQFCIKFRTDMFFTSTGFLRYYNRYPKKSSLMNFFERRIITCDSFTPNPERLVPKPFTPSDWFHFGLTSDVKKLWDIPLEPKEYSTWFCHHPYPPNAPEQDVMRYRFEQYIWLSCLRKYTDIPCEHQWDYGEHNRDLHELSLANNFIVLSREQAGVKFMKYGIGIRGWAAFYTHYDGRNYTRNTATLNFPRSLTLKQKLKSF
jgi:hypothetical protein